MANIRQASKNLCKKADFCFYGLSQMSFVGQARPQLADIFTTTASIQNIFIYATKLIFWLTNRNLYEHANIEGEINSTSFLFETENPSCFLFSVIFVGMHVVEHFRQNANSGRNRSENTPGPLEPNP